MIEEKGLELKHKREPFVTKIGLEGIPIEVDYSFTDSGPSLRGRPDPTQGCFWLKTSIQQLFALNIKNHSKNVSEIQFRPISNDPMNEFTKSKILPQNYIKFRCIITNL